jgi:putative acetyltransferase
MPEIRIRRATDGDGPAIGRLIADVFAEYPTCLFVADEFPELAAVATHYARAGGMLQVAERAGQLVGSLAITATTLPRRFELAKVYLARDVRGRGIATCLLNEALAFAREHEADTIELFTDTRFLDGHRFYERHGFSRVPGERWIATADGAWEYHYVRSL